MGLRTEKPAVDQWVCSHGRTLGESCRECEITQAKEVVRQWGDEVDRARRVIGNRLNFDRLLEHIDSLELALRSRK